MIYLVIKGEKILVLVLYHQIIKIILRLQFYQHIDNCGVNSNRYQLSWMKTDHDMPRSGRACCILQMDFYFIFQHAISVHMFRHNL